MVYLFCGRLCLDYVSIVSSSSSQILCTNTHSFVARFPHDLNPHLRKHARCLSPLPLLPTHLRPRLPPSRPNSRHPHHNNQHLTTRDLRETLHASTIQRTRYLRLDHRLQMVLESDPSDEWRIVVYKYLLWSYVAVCGEDV